MNEKEQYKLWQASVKLMPAIDVLILDWRVIEHAGLLEGFRLYVCEHICGRRRIISADALQDGPIKCDCITYKPMRLTYGLGRERVSAHRAMFDRCYSPLSQSFVNYGARGIKVAQEWHGQIGRHRYALLTRKSPGSIFSLDRIDNDADYSPWNVRWADAKTQYRNSRNFLEK